MDESDVGHPPSPLESWGLAMLTWPYARHVHVYVKVVCHRFCGLERPGEPISFVLRATVELHTIAATQPMPPGLLTIRRPSRHHAANSKEICNVT